MSQKLCFTEQVSLRRLLVPAVLAALAAVPAAFAAPVHPTGLPLTITLPAGWTATGASGDARLSAAGPNGARLAVTAGGSFPMSLPFTAFVSTETAAARKHYRAEDPHASVIGSKVMLASGPAVLIKATVTRGGAPSAIEVYSLLHKGVTYHFTYSTAKPQLASALPGFTSSAKSIRWAS
jgi:hypothetical protein